MDIMDYFRFGPVCILAIFLNTILAMPNPQSTRFFSGAPAVNFNDPATQFAGLGALGVTAFAASNVINGNDDIRFRPNVGVNFDPNTGSFNPALGLNAQVGNGPVAPTFNVGGQFNPNSGAIAPVVGTGLNVGDGDGLNPALTSNFALQNGQANPQLGVGANVGSFNLGSLGGFFGRRR